jgi:DMSO reductase anchor subunit
MAAGVLAASAVFFIPGVTSSWPVLLTLLIVLAEEGVGRWLFYEARVRQGSLFRS